MPPIKLAKVVSVSSEDPVHTASNLVKGDYSSKKWKSETPGEKKISAVFKFFEPATISGIDIGNENSAFVEVLVSRSAPGSDDYQVLLPATTMMTLREAKYSENTNAVKFFKSDDFCASSRNLKWDQVMIVCTQPYNVVTQFGISFVVFHTDDTDSSTPSSVPDLGKFHLKPLDQCGSSSIVSVWGIKKKEDPEQKGAAAVTAASRNGDIKLPSAKNAPVIAKVTSISTSDSDKFDNLVGVDDDDVVSQSQASASKKTPKTPRNRKDNTAAQTTKRAAPPAKGPTPKKKPKIAAVSAFNARSRPKKPFNQLMADVVFVISGFQNPLRSDLRNAALAMGAKYKADWDKSCTHLICAFSNTPKFNQVRGRGKIVKKEWVEKCYESRKRLPWRRYALDPSDQGQPESEEEIWEDTGPPPSSLDNRRRLNDTESEEEDDVEKEVKRIRKLKDMANQDEPMDVDKPSTSLHQNKRIPDIAGPSNVRDDGPSCSSSSNRDTSSAIDKNNGDDDVTCKGEKEAKLPDSYSDLPHIPMYFRDYKFLILDDIDEAERAKLKRYILPRLGTVVTDMGELSSPNSAYCVTEDKERYDEVKNDFPNVIGVLPDWIWLCHDENALQDYQAYCL